MRRGCMLNANSFLVMEGNLTVSGKRAFWSLTKAVEGNLFRSSFPSLGTIENQLAHIVTDKAELLDNIFADNSTLYDRREIPPTVPQYETTMKKVRFTQKAVHRAHFPRC